MTVNEKPTQELDDSNSKMDSLVRWRRETVWQLKSCGLGIDEIVETLRPKPGIKISHGTVCRDLKFKEKQVEKEFTGYIKNLVIKHNLAMTRVQRVLKEAWRQYARDERLAKEMLPIILKATEVEHNLLGDVGMIEKGIRAADRFDQLSRLKS